MASKNVSHHYRRKALVIQTALTLILICLLLKYFECFDSFLGFIKDNPTTATGIIAAIIGTYAIKNTARNAIVKNALDFETTYKHNEKIVEASLVIKFMLKHSSSAEIARYGLESEFFSNEAKALSTIFNEWERCANGVFHGIYDEDFLYGIYGSTVLFLYASCKPYLDKRKDHNSRVYNRFSWLALRWKIRRGSEK